MRALIIDDVSRIKISALKKHAENNPLTYNDLRDTVAGKKKPIGDDPSFSTHLSQGFRIVYSIEEQKIGKLSHLSISVDTENKLPSIPAVEMIMNEFGMGTDINDCVNVWIEENRAVNVLKLWES